MWRTKHLLQRSASSLKPLFHAVLLCESQDTGMCLYSGMYLRICVFVYLFIALLIYWFFCLLSFIHLLLCIMIVVSLFALYFNLFFLYSFFTLCVRPHCSQAGAAHAVTVIVLQGKVSILAHSLGSVLCYEILCNQPHLFDHLEFNMHGTPAPSDPSDPSRLADTLYNTHHSTEGRQQQQQQQPTQKRQASTEIGFAPLNSTDLDDSYQAASSCPTFPALGALKLPPKSVPGLGIAPGWKAKAEVRLQESLACSTPRTGS